MKFWQKQTRFVIDNVVRQFGGWWMAGWLREQSRYEMKQNFLQKGQRALLATCCRAEFEHIWGWVCLCSQQHGFLSSQPSCKLLPRLTTADVPLALEDKSSGHCMCTPILTAMHTRFVLLTARPAEVLLLRRGALAWEDSSFTRFFPGSAGSSTSHIPPLQLPCGRCTHWTVVI